MGNAIRHGEVILLPQRKKIPVSAESSTSVVVGDSDSGHNHVLVAENIKHWTDEETNELFVSIATTGKVVHQKTHDRHKDLELTPGTYRVIRKKEYDPIEKHMREVWD